MALCCAFACVAETPANLKYGPNDRLGAINNLSPEVVLNAAQLVKTGKVYSLAVELAPDNPVTGPSDYKVFLQPIPTFGANKIGGFSDSVLLGLGQPGTGMDGFGHAGRDGQYYNGVRAEDIYGIDGAKVFSIDTLPPIVSRGVLLDVARHRGATMVAEGMAINRAELEAIAKAQGMTIRRGDVVLLHTGWLELRSTDAAKFARGEPGLGKEGAQFLAELGVVAMGADTPGVEVNPTEVKGEYAPVHQILLVDNGVYLFENVKTKELAADRAYEFLFIVAAPRLVGTVQSIVHPVAIR